MAFFSLKASHFTNPIRLVLPGIIVSLIGGTAGFLLFNNPGKIRGKATWEAWNAVIQYEKIYDDNIITTTRYFDYETITGLKKYKDDVMHQIQMLTENYKNIKEESDVDNRLFAIINCKVDTYNQIHSMTDIFLDSLVRLAEHPEFFIPVENETDSSYLVKISETSVAIMNEYNLQRQHLIDRDSTTINNILQQLTDSYQGLFYHYTFKNRLPDEYITSLNYLYGSWNFLFDGGSCTLGRNKIASLTLDNGYTITGTWVFRKDYMLQILTEAKDSIYTFEVLNVSDRTIRLAINDSLNIIGYRGEQ